MVIDAETRRKIEEQAMLYSAAKEEVSKRIQDSFGVVKEKLKDAEDELMDEVEEEFGENPFFELLVKIDSGNPPTDAEVKRVLAKGVPKDFGPSEESFLSLLKEI